MSGCTLDTDVLIAALDRSDVHHARAKEALGARIATGTGLLICTVNYAEALVRPAADSKSLQVAVDAITALGIEPVAPTAQTARDAARHRALGISLADGFALATAQATRTALATFDKRVMRAAERIDLELALRSK